MVIKFHSISSQNQRNVNFICITVQDEIISSLCSLTGSKFKVTSSYVMWKYYLLVTYFSVLKLWFTLRASASAEAPEAPILFSSRLWKSE